MEESHAKLMGLRDFFFCVRENRKFEKCATHSRKSAMKCATLELAPLCGADDKKERENEREPGRGVR